MAAGSRGEEPSERSPEARQHIARQGSAQGHRTKVPRREPHASRARRPSTVGHLKAGLVVLVLVPRLHGRGDLRAALVDDLLGVHDALPIPMVLALTVALKEGGPPVAHCVLHLVLFVLDQAHVRLIEVRAGRRHLLTVPKEPCLVCVGVREVGHLLIRREGLHLAGCTLHDAEEEALLELLQPAEELPALVGHGLHDVADLGLEVRDCILDALLQLDLVGHELVLQPPKLLRELLDHGLRLRLLAGALLSLELREDLLHEAAEVPDQLKGFVLALLLRSVDRALKGRGLALPHLVPLLHPSPEGLDVVRELVPDLLLHLAVALQHREVLRLEVLREEILEEVLGAVEEGSLELLHDRLLLLARALPRCLELLTLLELQELVHGVALLCLSHSLPVDEHVIQVLQHWKIGQDVLLVGVVLADLVPIQANAPKVLELPQVVNLPQVFDVVVPQGKYVQLRAAIEALNLLDLVVIEGQVQQVLEVVQAFDFPDVVEG
mmetsp:Transcript_78433/g.237920  ORF Transcript_78433/g.237920 Transcript_78433/m.237920 type:complete len:495 (-) Transcript_78433:171-1655(-)